jgi:CRP/FNR family transcriptional regulator, cyclic AMP receptor protein
MSVIPDSASFQERVGSLPVVTYQAGENVLAAGSRSGQLLILKSGVVSIVRGEIEIAKVREPGAVLGELSALLDLPHTADVRALETSQFHVADVSTLLGTRSPSFTLQRFWRVGSTVPIRPSLN